MIDFTPEDAPEKYSHPDEAQAWAAGANKGTAICNITIGNLRNMLDVSNDAITTQKEVIESLKQQLKLETARADQLGKNCMWFIDKFDELHRKLCPNKNGSYQDRIQQVVEKVHTL